ncbi:hypothetical protein OAG71_03445, partial [bacterium]|nr:hypothetical protein [bacterium]
TLGRANKLLVQNDQYCVPLTGPSSQASNFYQSRPEFRITMSNTNSVYSIFKSRRKGRQAITTKLGYSNLEDRQLLAGDVFSTGSMTLDPVTSVLNIRGTDDVDDQVFISTQTENEVRVQFNGDFCIFARADVEFIRFNGMGGDDIFNSGLSDIRVTAIGGEGNDRLIGGSNVDRLVGDAGDDLLIGNEANDVILGGDGEDTLQGSEGNDTLSGGNDIDSLRGSSGDDTIRGDGGDDFISGDEGNDFLIGGIGNDRILGSLGNDTVIGGNGDDTIDGGEGNDGLFGGNGVDTISGQAGIDRINGNADGDFISGGDGDDVIQGAAGDDTISGNNGNDRLFGTSGDDVLSGNGGDDFILGGDGADTIQGGAGNDTIGGLAGNDSISGNAGEDLIFGGDGNDRILGGSQDDALFGQAGSDTILGGAGSDRVAGNEGNDYLSGEFGNDLVLGNEGNDRLFGGIGDDVLRGGDGNDGLFGGTGRNNRLFGDGGADRFISTGNEQIVDQGTRDVEVVFRNGSSQWTDGEITAIDDGLHLMQLRLGNNQLAVDPIVADPIVFLKQSTVPSSASLALTTLDEIITPTINLETGDVVNITSLERQYVFGDWNENDAAANALRAAEVPRAIAIAWASTDAIETVVPNNNQIFNRFIALSQWQSTRGDFFRVSEDGTAFYRQDASFADETGRINEMQDWASAWQLFFNPIAEEVVPDTPVDDFVPDDPFDILLGQPATLITGDSVALTSFLQPGFQQPLNNFGFRLDDAGLVNIFTGDPTNGVQDTIFDTQVFLFALNEDGSLGFGVASDDDSGDGFDSIINLNLPAGDYVLVLGDFPLDQAEATTGIGDGGSGGQFNITFEGTDGVVQLPSGRLNAAPVIPDTPGIDTGLVAKLNVLDQLFSSLRNF